MFTAALFTVVKTWKPAKCPSIDDWIRKIWCLYTTEYHSTTREDEILPLETMWMDLENAMLSERSQTEKTKNHRISLICVI